jgi:hypothetical protein
VLRKATGLLLVMIWGAAAFASSERLLHVDVGGIRYDLRVAYVLVGNLGHEHFANCVVRPGPDGPHLVAWGDRIVQGGSDRARPCERTRRSMLM